MSLRGNLPNQSTLRPEAVAVARQALAESRLRGLPAAEEYRVIADRLYRHGYRDLPSGSLVNWIEETVAADYEHFLALRQLGERFHAALASGDLARAAWTLACDLDPEARARLVDGIQRLIDIERDSHPTPAFEGDTH